MRSNWVGITIVVTVALACFAVLGGIIAVSSKSSDSERDAKLSSMKPPVTIVGLAKEENNGGYIVKVSDGTGAFYTFYDDSLKSRKIGDVLK